MKMNQIELLFGKRLRQTNHHSNFTEFTAGVAIMQSSKLQNIHTNFYDK